MSVFAYRAPFPRAIAAQATSFTVMYDSVQTSGLIASLTLAFWGAEISYDPPFTRLVLSGDYPKMIGMNSGCYLY
jgi:hypothetical protein